MGFGFDDPSIGSKIYISPSSDNMSSGNASNNASSDNNSYLFKKITDAAVQFRESYRNNQYIQVTGFAAQPVSHSKALQGRLPAYP
jgi:hypothetical protein